MVKPDTYVFFLMTFLGPRDYGSSNSDVCSEVFFSGLIYLARLYSSSQQLISSFRPAHGYYFPDLYQQKYELEDGVTSDNTIVRFGFDETEFPGYSMRGYAQFSLVQV